MGLNKCQICKSGEIKPLFKDGVYGYMGCQRCNFVFLSNSPNSNYLKKLYSYNEGVDVTLKKINPLLSILLGNVFVRKTISLYGSWVNVLRAKSVEKYGKKNKLLDVGCGVGDFLSEMSKRGWEIYGLEVGDHLVNLAEKKLGKGKVHKGYLKDVGSKRFSTITLWHVFEHIKDIDKTLKKINSILTNGGSLIIEVPHSRSLNLKIFKNTWTLLLPPQHLNFWSKSSLTRVLSDYGFSVIKIDYPLDFPFVFFSSLVKRNRKYIFTLPFTLPISVLLSLYTSVVGRGDVIRVYSDKIKNI